MTITDQDSNAHSLHDYQTSPILSEATDNVTDKLLQTTSCTTVCLQQLFTLRRPTVRYVLST